ncbi:OmpA family protein [Mesorhizobium sp. KR9-304]|uniref:OmpA family protein n=1 Tax=Mesorhizobium sp. KR9-304 TaxID=3156614 RepID=UPI0032B41562
MAMRFLLGMMLILSCLTHVRAQEEPISEVTVNMLVKRLAPSGIKLRGARGITVEAREGQEARIDLAVGFAYNSAELTGDARQMLGTVAEALGDDVLRNHRFRLAGHTDAVGTQAYNQQLSEARAEAVRAYLVMELGIEEWRLEAVGFGKTQLLFPDAPKDGRNRRVQISTLQ